LSTVLRVKGDHKQRSSYLGGDVDDSNPSGSFEFEAEAGSEDDFFPISVRFTKSQPWVDIDVNSVELLNEGQDVGFAKEIRSVAESYTIV
jgi:coatomer subunit delta